MCHGQIQPTFPAATQGLSEHCLLIRNAAWLNQEGATLLVSGDLNNAIIYLQNAVDLLSQAGGFLAAPAIGSAFFSGSFPFDKHVPTRSLGGHPTVNELQQIRKLTTPNEDGSFFVYSSPFIFQPIPVDVPTYATNCAAVVLYNLGLALHQRGRLADSRSLYRAQRLYEMSLALVSLMPCQAACSNLKVAATNNKAHVQFEVSEVKEAKVTLHSLLSILGATKADPPPFAEVEIEKFYMNILHLNGSTVAGAA